MQIRWGIFWRGDCLTSDFYEGSEGWDEPQGTVWSMGIAYDTIVRLDYIELVDTEEEERIMRGGKQW